jgi:son of sevenless-like protein
MALNGIAGTAPPGTMYVRALYDYEADDRTSLSFHEGDIIQVITQLESGWWDGVINGVRGWFPSNYCRIINNPDDMSEGSRADEADHADEETDDHDVYDDNPEDENDSDREDINDHLHERTHSADKSKADFWIPQATPDGRLFYYNMITGHRSMELPMESPASSGETGPRDRMNATIPEKTRPPPEMMARGLTQDEDDDSATSVSELEGESIMLASRGSLVS